MSVRALGPAADVNLSGGPHQQPVDSMFFWETTPKFLWETRV